MIKNFKEKFGPWGIVTGATDGIGLAIARELAKLGLNLVLVGRRDEILNKLSSELSKSYSVEIRTLAIDVSSEAAITKIASETERLDIGLFVAAAGFGTSGYFIEQPLYSELNMIDVNCRAVVEQSHYFGNLMVKKGRGGIILFSSLVAFQGTPYSATYSATKSFMQNFAEALHVELKPFGVSVLATAPGPVNSGFASRAHMQMGSASTPDSIAVGTLRALGNKVTVRPDFLSKFLGWSLLTMNRWGRVLTMKKIMGKMTEHRRA